MAEHSKGPWQLAARVDGSRYSIGKTIPCINGLSARFEIAAVYPPDDAEMGYTDDFLNPCTAEANARLIAASPMLLEALQNLLRSYDTFDPDDWINAEAKARAAITLATGKDA